MNQPSENRLTPSQIERKVNYADFILKILDDRYKIEEALLEKATSIHMAFNGHHCESYETPEVLDHYLPPFSEITVDLSATRDDSDVTTIDQITIFPEDSSPLLLRQHDEFTTIQCGEEHAILPQTALESTLRQLLPPIARDKATVSQILEYINAYSPESNYTIEYSEGSNGHQSEISLSKTETLHDSIETIEVTKYAPHASGAQVGTRMHLSESTSRRRQMKHPDQTEHELVIEALHKHDESEELTIETILNTNGRTVVVDTATRRHINDITEVLDILK